MLNQIVLVGKMSEIKEQDGKVNLKLNVQNELVDVTLTEHLGKSVLEYCQNDSVLGIKGKITYEDGNMIILAEKVTFLAPKKDDNDLER